MNFMTVTFLKRNLIFQFSFDRIIKVCFPEIISFLEHIKRNKLTHFMAAMYLGEK